METKFFFKHMLKNDEQQLMEYFEKKIPKFEKLLTHFSQDDVILTLKGEYFKKHNAFAVELVLRAAGQTISAHETSHAITKAVDLAKDRLEMQIKKDSALFTRKHRSPKERNSLKSLVLQEA